MENECVEEGQVILSITPGGQSFVRLFFGDCTVDLSQATPPEQRTAIRRLVREAVTAERERCAGIADQWKESKHLACNKQTLGLRIAACHIACEIRGDVNSEVPPEDAAMLRALEPPC